MVGNMMAPDDEEGASKLYGAMHKKMSKETKPTYEAFAKAAKKIDKRFANEVLYNNIVNLYMSDDEDNVVDEDAYKEAIENSGV